MAFLISLLAGLATGIGGLSIYLIKKPEKRILSSALGFSSGVMAYVAIGELFFESRLELASLTNASIGLFIVVLAFMVGVGLVLIVKMLMKPIIKENNLSKDKLKNVTLVTMVALIIHNFPEGFATFLTSYTNLDFGITIAIAIALHNIPEGMAIAIPNYFATNKKGQSLVKSFVSGFAEPLGALVAFLFLAPLLSEMLLAILYGIIAGIMFFVSIFELLPVSSEYQTHKESLKAFLFGFALMGLLAVII